MSAVLSGNMRTDKPPSLFCFSAGWQLSPELPEPSQTAPGSARKQGPFFPRPGQTAAPPRSPAFPDTRPTDRPLPPPGPEPAAARPFPLSTVNRDPWLPLFCDAALQTGQPLSGPIQFPLSIFRKPYTWKKSEGFPPQTSGLHRCPASATASRKSVLLRRPCEMPRHCFPSPALRQPSVNILRSSAP